MEGPISDYYVYKRKHPDDSILSDQVDVIATGLTMYKANALVMRMQKEDETIPLKPCGYKHDLYGAIRENSFKELQNDIQLIIKTR